MVKWMEGDWGIWIRAQGQQCSPATVWVLCQREGHLRKVSKVSVVSLLASFLILSFSCPLPSSSDLI